MAREGSGDRPLPFTRDNKSFEALISAIFVLRFLNQKRAERTKCLTEQSELDKLLDYNHRLCLNLPHGDKYRAKNDKIRADRRRFEAYLELRAEQEEVLDREIECLLEEFEIQKTQLDKYVKPWATIPEVSCLKSSAELQAVFARCQFYSRVLAGGELELSGVEGEKTLLRDRIYGHASRLAARGTGSMNATAPREQIHTEEPVEEDYSPEGVFQKNLSMLTWHRMRRSELRITKQNFSEPKTDLVKSADKQLVEFGILQPIALDVKE